MNIFEIISKFYDVTHIPMKIYARHKLEYQIPENYSPLDVTTLKLEMMLDKFLPACYTISQNCFLTGLIYCEHTEKHILVGPVPLQFCSTSYAKKILLQVNGNDNQLDEFLLWLHTIPICDSIHFQKILHFLACILNNKADVQVQYIAEPEHPDTSSLSEDISSINTRKIAEHIDILQENLYTRRILSYIESGNVLELQKTLHELLHAEFGPSALSLSTDRFIKNIFIGANSMACRAAIQGGLATPVALSISDNFIVQVESCSSYDETLFLLTQMFISYTKSVADTKLYPESSPLVHKIVKTINDHLYEKITPTDISINLHMDLSYLCRHFKQETGKTISQYINEIKLKESKRLIRDTDLTLAQIAMQLGFSSQSYFHYVFKKVTGMTPREYSNHCIP